MKEGKEDKEKGDKIILPSSAFEKLAQMDISYPMQFELTNESEYPVKRTHVGVLEFTANEGQCFVPYWIMENLNFAGPGKPEGGIITVRNVTLPLANFLKFRPQSVDFLDISNPKAVLESTLRNFSCMTKGEIISLHYNGKIYKLEVVDVKPQDACSIVEADVKVDFEAPVGYKEPEKLRDEVVNSSASITHNTDAKKVDEEEIEKQRKASNMKLLAEARAAREKQLREQTAAYIPFAGKGTRVDGKVKGVENHNETSPTTQPRVPKKSKWSKKNTAGKWSGTGNTLS
eukprot:CAMPEP_0204836192 /NCGR_PEP_ID=MMETSP1346-20131115/24413_1 /ASSEMBLY_ACC=CAM_ASM_000771 /TAXON_ID=215587 /ORGANISM="Aplanochytrium stocchinoi, Strain GSBS06" /LENGTH=287 /DNA_ID=CAMNT_0051970713 /DNA_START=424 /DNA_END=1287 /DNA_ORIENTATION=-